MILANNLTKVYGNQLAVDQLSLNIPQGQFFGLLGPNGSGKTTSIHMLSTLIQPTSGSITINGVNVKAYPRQVRRDIGLVFQESALDRMLSIEENLYFCAGLHGINKNSIKIRMNLLLELFELQSKKRVPVGSLSGGMRRAVDIIRGVLHSPKVLFLDEPTVGLDLPSRRKIWRFIRQLIDDHKLTVVLTTHYLEEAAPCDNVAFIRLGKLVSKGSPEELIEQLGKIIVEVNGPNTEDYIETLNLSTEDYMLDGGTLLIRVHKHQHNQVEQIQATLRESADIISVRKSNLNDVFIWLSSKGQGTS
ncbi:MAG: ABC transporter ATP-binding protein [Proteobacteria bacterium]|nr:ABC transporter ATP-binding protein [Pseudomonadota bacterium]MDA1331383.1 ABC transporter ATP-binding protein [Pseudomonadota bacterium]